MSYPTFDEIVAALQAQFEKVAEHYAPGGHRRNGKYWALNPGRADRRIGSFYIPLSGPYAGRWRDEATNEGGDMLDLIQLKLGCDRRTAVEEAKSFLGLAQETPEARKRRKEREAELERQRAEKDREEVERQKRKRQRAHAVWLASHERIEGTPVAAYLAGRAIGLDRLGRIPRALRYAPKLRYYWMDPATGEVFEGEYPAMVAAIHGPAQPGVRPEVIGVHRTYLEQVDGRWGKARVPKPKLVMGQKQGGFIRLWTGIGPRGGKGAPLSRAPAGSRIYITEGIEDGLSVAVLKPDARVIAACDLGNIGAVRLPPAIRVVVIVADNDPDPALWDVVERAMARFAAEGRTVLEPWRNHYGGKDINDALIAATRAEGAA